MIRLESVLKPFGFLASSGRLQNVFKTSSKRLEGVLKMSWRRFCKMSWRRLGKTSWTRLEDVLKTSWKDILKTYSQDKYFALDQEVLKTSSEDAWLRQIYLSWSRRLQDVFIKTNVWWDMTIKQQIRHGTWYGMLVA